MIAHSLLIFHKFFKINELWWSEFYSFFVCVLFCHLVVVFLAFLLAIVLLVNRRKAADGYPFCLLKCFVKFLLFQLAFNPISVR